LLEKSIKQNPYTTEKKKQIVIADPSITFLETLLVAKEAKDYAITVVNTGSACLDKVTNMIPQLAVIDLTMPHVHGIEILKIIKSSPHTASMGVVMTSYQVTVQHYHAAVDNGANYFLPKPFGSKQLFALIQRYFSEGLQPEPFHMIRQPIIEQDHCYRPRYAAVTSYIRFWGTRGSSPVSGSQYIRYGGNTSCLEIFHNQKTIIIDAGTGIRELGDAINVEANSLIHLFISHTHWDHITGFPFFKPLYQKNCNIVVWSPVGFEKSTQELFDDMLAYAYFPVRLDEMKARVTFKDVESKVPVSIGDITIESHFTNHPGLTMGFKIKMSGSTIGYVTDNEMLPGYHGHPNNIDRTHPVLEPHLTLIEFLQGCDLIIHEAQFFPGEYRQKVGWGHSSVPNATVLMKYTQCKKWIITHHDPSHKDTDLEIKARLHEEVIRECHLNIQIMIAHDGLTIPLCDYSPA